MYCSQLCRICNFYTVCKFCLIEIISHYINVFIYERDVNISLSYLARTRKEPGQSDGINDKLPKIKRFLVFITIHLLHCVIIRVLAVFQIKPLLTVLEGNLFLCQVVAQT